MVKVHDQPVSAEAHDEPEAITAHERRKASQQGKEHGEVGSRDHTAVAGDTSSHGMGIGKGIVLGQDVRSSQMNTWKWCSKLFEW